MGIIAYNDSSMYVRGLSRYRPLAAFSYVGRYRLVDIPISNMTNSGMDQIDVYTNGDPKVLFDHIGSARHYNINNKHGHVGIIPVFTDGTPVEFVTDIESYYNNLYNIEEDTNDYVVIAPCNYIYKANFADLLETHIESGADVSILYKDVKNAKNCYRGCFLIDVNKQKGISALYSNDGSQDQASLSLSTYIMSKKVFIDLVKKAKAYSSMFWMTDILNMVAKNGEMDIRAINYRGPVFPIFDLRSYFESNMAMLNESNMAFFNDPNWPIYTRTNDSPPTLYFENGTSQGALISNGCEISGDVKNSILGRGVKIGKGSHVDNCLILPGAVVGEGAMLTNVIVDKDAKIIHKTELAGYDEDPLYIARREVV